MTREEYRRQISLGYANTEDLMKDMAAPVLDGYVRAFDK